MWDKKKKNKTKQKKSKLHVQRIKKMIKVTNGNNGWRGFMWGEKLMTWMYVYVVKAELIQ